VEQDAVAGGGCPKPLENGTKDEKDEEDHALDDNVENKKLPEIDGTTIVRRKIGVDIDDLNNNSVFCST
jgi:hypothetical protein